MFGENNSQLMAALDNLTIRVKKLEKQVSAETPQSPDIERFLAIRLQYDEIKVSDSEEYERPFDNVRAIFDRETGELKYIGLVDDLPF